MALAVTEEQYDKIIETIREGFPNHFPNNRIATILVVQANLGLRVGDVLNLKLNDIIKDGNRYRLDIVEEKTTKKRTFTVPTEVFNYIKMYTLENGIKPTAKIFPLTVRAVQKHLKACCDYLGYTNISTHSFRKYFATEIYINNQFDVRLVQKLLQHSSIVTTQRYIGISDERTEKALSNHIRLK